MVASLVGHLQSFYISWVKVASLPVGSLDAGSTLLPLLAFQCQSLLSMRHLLPSLQNLTLLVPALHALVTLTSSGPLLQALVTPVDSMPMPHPPR